MSKIVPIGLFHVLFALPAAAQSVNVDFGYEPSPLLRPSTSYGAATTSRGFWNTIASGSSTEVFSTSGAPTTAVVVPNLDVYFGYRDISGTALDDERLLDDFIATGGPSVDISFSGLEPGEYEVYTIVAWSYACCPVYVEVIGSQDPVALVQGRWTGAFHEGDNYSRHHATVSSGDIHVHISLYYGHGQDYVGASGIQLVKVGEEIVGLPMCFGDAPASGCPCANVGELGRGCANSTNAFGAFLAAIGTTSPDTLVLRASGELAYSLTIFMQGTTAITPVVFGDGVRCAGGSILRLYTKNASDGYAAAPGPSDLSITARSAALGHPIPAGHRRYYAAYYRDATAGFCAPPQGSSFNTTQTVKIDW